MPSIINATTTNGLVTSADNSGSLQLQTNSGTTAVTINTAQGVSVLNCLGVGNATPSTSGAGITFPATQSASTDANTLDDYEEGTWTPTLTRSTTNPTVTYGNRDGRYVKIGRMVYASCQMVWSGNTGGSGVFWFVSGLPFTNSGNGANYAQGTIQDFDGITFAAARTQLGGYAYTGETRFYLCCGGSGQATADVTPGNSGYLYMAVVYIASA